MSPTQRSTRGEEARTASAGGVGGSGELGGRPTTRQSWLVMVAVLLLPGALAGTQVAGLLFFLNPHIPFGPQPIFRAVLLYGVLLGGILGLALGLVSGFRWPLLGRVIPWILTLILALSAAAAWIHAYHYAFYLPPGINRRLLKAAILLSLAALICFYTALLHHLRHRPYGRRSQALFLIVAAASIYVVLERREAFSPEVGPDPRASSFASSQRPQLILIGIDSATLDAILPLAEQGRLPFFAEMLQGGAYTRLQALQPTLSLPLWTTLVSGKYPYQHGIVGEEVFESLVFAEWGPLYLLPIGVGFESWGLWRGRSRPTSTADLRVLAVWEILSRLGVSTGVIGWPLTKPAPRSVRLVVSQEFFVDEEGSGVAPVEFAERARLFRTSVDELDPELLAPFGNDPPAPLLEALAEDLVREELLSFLLDQQEPSLEAYFLRLPGLGEVSRRFYGAYAATQFEGAQDPVLAEAAQMLSAYYAHLDGFLSRIWNRARTPRLLAVVSVHGVEGPDRWRSLWNGWLRRPSLEGYVERGPDGLLLMQGEGIQGGEMLRTSELVDLVPTLLYGLGFPIARDLDGAVVTNAFETGFLARQPLKLVPSYETFSAPLEE